MNPRDMAAPSGEHPEAKAATATSHATATAGSQPLDPWLFFAAIALSGLGLVTVYSAAAWLGHAFHGSWEYYLLRHSVFLAAGTALMFVAASIDYRILRRFAPQLMLVALTALVLVLVIGQEINGARRWINLGPINLQPSEFAKIALTIFLAANLARQGEHIRNFKFGFLPLMVVASLTMLLVLLEKDLGTTVLLGALTMILLFVAGTRLAYVAAVVMTAAPLLWFQIIGVDYRRGRLEQFLSGDSYQVDQALIAIGSGGLWGRGLGNGRQKLGFLPENHTDFILATIGEELGFIGVVVALVLIGLVVWRGLAIAQRASDRFGTYLAMGISSLFGLQAIINVAVVLEVLPAKGITLPMLSYGGSSLLVSMTAIGLLLSVSRRPAPWRLSDQRRRRQRGRGKEAGSTKGRTRGNMRHPVGAGA